MPACEVCSTPTHHPQAPRCRRCKRLLNRVDTRRGFDREARLQALKGAWDGEAFRCYYTGIKLILDNHGDPRYLTFDHRTPRVESDVVVAAAVINDMKSDLAEDEFRAVVTQLAQRFSGGRFDDAVLHLQHWKRI